MNRTIYAFSFTSVARRLDFYCMQHFMNSLAGPRDEVERLVTKGLDLQKNANKSSVAVIQQQVSSVVTRLSLLDKQANEALNSLQVGLALLQYSIK